MNNWDVSSTMNTPTLEELTKMMESFPKSKKMYLIADDPFLMKPIEFNFPDPFQTEREFNSCSFKVRSQYGVSLMTDRAAILYTAIADEDRRPAPNIRLRIACLAIAIVLFVMIWSMK